MLEFNPTGDNSSGGIGVMRPKRWVAGTLLILSVLFVTSCTNLQAIQDFGLGTTDFASSYERLYSGAYDTCLSTAEMRNVIIELGEVPSRSPLTQLRGDQQLCAPYKPNTEAFGETSLALSDFGRALQLVAKQNQGPSFKNPQFISQFSGIDKNITNVVPELAGSNSDVEAVNQWKQYFLTFFAQETPQKVIMETGDKAESTLNLLTVFADIYQAQLDDYERNIKVLDTILHDTGSSDAIKRTFVINKSRDLNTRTELLKNYNLALTSVKGSYKKLYQRSELESPHYSDPIFQQDMREFLINISNLVQQSKIISE